MMGFLPRYWLLALALAGSHSAITQAADCVFPTQEFETTITATSEEPSENEAGDAVMVWQTSVTWPTEFGRTYVVESQRGEDSWKAASDPFEGDGKPVDFVDRFKSIDGSISYRLSSTRTFDGKDPRVSKLRSGILWDSPLGALLAHLDFDAAPGLVYELEKSYDAENWTFLASVAEKKPIEISIEDPAPINKRVAHYRVFLSSPSVVIPVVPVPSGSSIAHRRLDAASSAQQTEFQHQLNRQRELVAQSAVARPYRVVRSFEFTTVFKSVPANMSYAYISLKDLGVKGTMVDLSDSDDVLSFVSNSDGTVNMFVWIAGTSYDVSQITGQRFHRVLAMDASRAMLGTVLENGQEMAVGYRVRLEKGKAPVFVPLSNEELRDFKLIRRLPKFEGSVNIGGVTYTPTADGTLVSKHESKK